MFAFRSIHAYAGDAAVVRRDPGDEMPHQHLAPHRTQAVTTRLPHLARSEAWIAEFVDQALDRGVAALDRGGVEDGPRQREPLDTLGRPLGPDLGAGDAPHLLGVGLEEDL